jgi:hypothetical protein
LASAARGAPSGRDHALRIAICGWEPTTELSVEGVTSTFTGDSDKGTGETTATFVAPSKSEASLRCEGRVAYAYEYRPAHAGSHGSYYDLTSIHRVGGVPLIFAAAEQHAVSVALDAPVTAFADAWKLPDGEPGAVFRVDVPAPGPYRIKLSTRWATPAPLNIAVFQDKMPVVEGDDRGKRGFWALAPGPAWFLLKTKAASPVELRIVAGE